MNSIMNFLYYGTCAFLHAFADYTGTTYEQVNVYGYGVVGALIFYFLYMGLIAVLYYKLHKQSKVITTPKILLGILFLLGIVGFFQYPLFDMLNPVNTHLYYERAIALMYKLGGGHTLKSYITSNVWYLCVIGPIIFFALFCTFTWNIFGKITSKVKTNISLCVIAISLAGMIFGTHIVNNNIKEGPSLQQIFGMGQPKIDC